jgi:hypothetical protein
VGGLLWYGVTRYQTYTEDLSRSETAPASESAARFAKPPTKGQDNRFSCDGRKYCSEMTSCDEAKFFLTNCPGMEMDGDRDGVPCERQWCD